MTEEKVSTPEPGDRPMPYPVEEGVITVLQPRQAISEEQRERLVVWLRANGIEPKNVSPNDPVTIRYKAYDGRQFRHVIAFTEYVRDADGHIIANEIATAPPVVTCQRWVRQRAALAPETEGVLQGWHQQNTAAAPESDSESDPR